MGWGRRRVWSHGEHVSEELSEGSQGDEPRPDDDEDSASPSLDGRCALLQRVDDVFSGRREQQCQREHQRDDCYAGDGEADERCGGSSGDEGLAGQTGQDRTGSTKASEQIDEAE